MAIVANPFDSNASGVEILGKQSRAKDQNPVELVLTALASLKLTVVLFALAIFVTLVGTLAQTEMDIWQAIPAYFRTWVMWVDLKLFFPPSFFGEFREKVPGLTLPAPGGFTVGVLMMVNLLAAHLWRFKIQAKGAQLIGGWVVLAVGALVTWLIVSGGHNAQGIQAAPPFSWQTLWTISRLLLLVLFLASGWAWLQFAVVPLSRSPSFGLRFKLALVGAAWLAMLAIPVYYFVIVGYYLGDEGARILWQLLQGAIGGVIMLVGCWLVFQKRGPVVLIHAGVGLLMINELIVTGYHAENQMTLQEGETSNFMRDVRSAELALVNRSGTETDEHIVIPYSLLASNAARNADLKKAGKPLVPVDDPAKQLPVEVVTLQAFKNHDLVARKEGDGNPATVGHGLKETIVERPVAKGAGGDSTVDFAAAYVQLRERGSGKDLGVYLVSQFDGEQPDPYRSAETVKLADAEYKAVLRFKRTFLPYQVSLVDVRKDDYLASDTPKNYSSDIILRDPAKGVEEKTRIWMNNPLRYSGQTFYQSGYDPGRPAKPIESTTLAIVKNVGWMTPYVACSIVAIALLAHFYQALLVFLQRQERAEEASASFDYASIAAFAGVGVLGLLFCVSLLARGPKVERGGLDLEAFGALPAAHKGRVKPMDTLARVTLLEISKSESVKTANGKITATQWLLDVIADKAEDHKVFRIEDEEVLQLFGLPAKSPFRYSINELRPKFEEFLAQLQATQNKKDDELNRKQVRLRELYRSLEAMITLRMAFNPPQLPKLPTQEELEANPSLRQQVGFAMQMAISESTEELRRRQPPLALPVKQEDGKVEWLTPHDAWVNSQMQRARQEQPDPAYDQFAEIIDAYGAKDVFKFSQAISTYRNLLAERAPEDFVPEKVSLELWFNRVQPFTQGVVLYVLAFVLAMVGCAIGGFSQKWAVSWGAFGLILATLALHTTALVLRVYLSGRPPVTNLYSSAVFIGWGCVLMGVVIELLFGRGIGNLTAAICGFASLLIASYLGAGGDTIEVMQAVLDTQFWLATHVTCITLGYATTYVAGILGVLYVLLGYGTPMLTADLRKTFYQLIYGVTCFSIFFSFVGTVLGGLWADDSWGRFWGWDPKENGALIIVLWNALVLHARWDRLVGERGLAVLAIGGNIVTSWSWFGVNQLGVGLHSYGFTSGVVVALGGFVISQLALIGLGMLPTALWWSYREHPAKATPA